MIAPIEDVKEQVDEIAEAAPTGGDLTPPTLVPRRNSPFTPV
jgi:hypothetical protein